MAVRGTSKSLLIRYLYMGHSEYKKSFDIEAEFSDRPLKEFTLIWKKLAGRLFERRTAKMGVRLKEN